MASTDAYEYVMTGCDCSSEEISNVDDVLGVLQHPIRREIVSHFEEAQDSSSATVEELTTHIDAHLQNYSPEELGIVLYQVHLPKLQSHGWLIFDDERGHVQYQGDDSAEQVLQDLHDMFTA